MTDRLDSDSAIVEAARAALQRSEIAHRQTAATPDMPSEWAADHSILAERAADYEQRLAYLDPARRLDLSGFHALSQAEEELRREAASWRTMAGTATESWAPEFLDSAKKADRAADAVHSLWNRLVDRDRAADMEHRFAGEQQESER